MSDDWPDRIDIPDDLMQMWTGPRETPNRGMGRLEEESPAAIGGLPAQYREAKVQIGRGWSIRFLLREEEVWLK